jgi:hypothetical protein
VQDTDSGFVMFRMPQALRGGGAALLGVPVEAISGVDKASAVADACNARMDEIEEVLAGMVGRGESEREEDE